MRKAHRVCPNKQYLSKAYTEEWINELSAEEVDKFFSNYEGKLLGQMVKSLGKSIIRMYLMGACATLGMSNQDVLSEDLESDLFLNSALQRFTCKLYCKFGSFLAPPSIGLITSRHNLSEQNVTGMKMEMRKEATEQLAIPSKYTGLWAAIAVKLMIGFWFGIVVIFTIGVVDSLTYWVGVLMSSSKEWGYHWNGRTNSVTTSKDKRSEECSSE